MGMGRKRGTGRNGQDQEQLHKKLAESKSCTLRWRWKNESRCFPWGLQKQEEFENIGVQEARNAVILVGHKVVARAQRVMFEFGAIFASGILESKSVFVCVSKILLKQSIMLLSPPLKLKKILKPQASPILQPASKHTDEAS